MENFSQNINLTNQTPNGSTSGKVISLSELYIESPILGIGIIFNLINIAVFQKSKTAIRFATFMQCLSFSDLGMCVFGIIYYIVNNLIYGRDLLEGYWFQGTALLNYVFLGLYISFQCASSVITVIVSSIRCHMIRHPYQFIKSLSLIRIKLICLAVYICTFLLIFITLLYYIWLICFKNTDEEKLCESYLEKLPHVEGMRYYIYAEAFIFGPCVITAYVICFITINIGLRRSGKRSYVLSDKDKEKRVIQSQRVTRTLLVILIIDTICMFPTTLDYMVDSIAPNNYISNAYDHIAGRIYDEFIGILLTIRPTYNLLVYFITNAEYRRNLMFLFSLRRSEVS